jgi:starvation-inducible DNA-binding protein
MFRTKNDLGAQTREAMTTLLNARLADAIDLQTQCKQAHWNVKGPGFYELHLLFDKVNESVEEYVDEIAERIVQLGGVAEGTARSVASRSTLADYPQEAIDGQAHAGALSSALAVFAEAVRTASDAADRSADADTMDLFIEISRGTDKWLWMVEAHLPHSLALSTARPRPVSKKAS